MGKIFGQIKTGFRAGKEARELVMGNRKTWTMIFAMGLCFWITLFVFSLLYRLFLWITNSSTTDGSTLLPTLLASIMCLLAVVLIGGFSMHYAKSLLTLKREGSFFNSFTKSFTFSLSRLKQPFAWIFVLVGFPFWLFLHAAAPACLIAILYVNGGFKKSLVCSWFLFRKFFWEAFGFHFYFSLISLAVFLLMGIAYLPIRPVVIILSSMLGEVFAYYFASFAVVALYIPGLGFLVAIGSFFALNLYKRAAVMRPDLLQ